MTDPAPFGDTAPGPAGTPGTGPTSPHGPAHAAAAQPRAVVGRRIVAALLDLVVLAILSFLLAAVFGGSTAGGGEVGFELTGAPALLLFVLGFGYYIVLEGLRGQTLGKMALGITVVGDDGQPAGWGAVVIRNLLRLVDGFFFYVVGLIVMLATAQKQRVGDLAAKTLVVRR